MNEDLRLKGVRVLIRFFEPGACGYDNDEKRYFASQENLMNICSSHEGVPLIIDHQDVNSNNIENICIGYVGEVFRNNAGIMQENGEIIPPDHWGWCEGIITDSDALNLITRQNWKVSNSYIPIFANETGFDRNGSKYDAEIVGGEGLHIAIVKAPRYEGTLILPNARRIVKNSKDSKQLDNKKTNLTEKVIINSNYMSTIKDTLNKFSVKKIFSKVISNESEEPEVKEEPKSINLDASRKYMINGKEYEGKDILNTIKNTYSKNDEKSEEESKKEEVKEGEPEVKEDIQENEIEPDVQETEELKEEAIDTVVDSEGSEILPESDYNITMVLSGKDILNMYSSDESEELKEEMKEEESEMKETEEKKDPMNNSKDSKKSDIQAGKHKHIIDNSDNDIKKQEEYIDGFKAGKMQDEAIKKLRLKK